MKKINFEYPDELSKNVGKISLHFQRLQYVIFEFVSWLLGDTNTARKEICSYSFDRLVKLMDLLVTKELSIIASVKDEYEKVYNTLKAVQSRRNKTIHSNFIITYNEKTFTVRYNIKDVFHKGKIDLKSIKKIDINELESLKELTKKAVSDLSDFYSKFRALSSLRN